MFFKLTIFILNFPNRELGEKDAPGQFCENRFLAARKIIAKNMVIFLPFAIPLHLFICNIFMPQFDWRLFCVKDII